MTTTETFTIDDRVVIDGTDRTGTIVGVASWIHPLDGYLVHGYVIRLAEGAWLDDGPRDAYVSHLLVHESGLKHWPEPIAEAATA